MDSLYLEERLLNGQVSLSRDLAYHLYTRGPQVRVVIVAAKPSDLLASTRKQWMKLLRQVQRERASTLKAARIIELAEQINWMQKVSFACQASPDGKDANIVFATAQELAGAPSACSSLYLTARVTEEMLRTMSRRMPPGSIVVRYTA